MELAVISLVILIVGLFLMPIYSSYLIEWRIKKVVGKYKLEDLIDTIRTVMDALAVGEKEE